MNGGDLGKQFDALKRQVIDLVADLHARKLAIPAGALLLAIVAAMVVMPGGSTTPAPPANGSASVTPPKTVTVARVSLIGQSSLDDDVALSNSNDPFIGKGSAKCQRVGKGTPKQYDCMIGDLKVHVICPDEGGGSELCADDAATGSSGSAGASGAVGGDVGLVGDGSTGSTGKKKSSSKKKKTTYHVINLTLDGRSYKNVVAGDELPNKANLLAIFAGTNDSNNRGIFLAADGVTVTGTDVDAELGNFELAKGESATLTDALGVQHKLTLKSITKVTK